MATNKVFETNSPLSVTVTNPTTPASGDPVRWGAKAGVATGDEDTDTGMTVVDFDGVYDLSVKAVDGSGNSAVAVGDALYYVDADTPKLSKKATGVLIGHAMETISTGSTATIRVRLAG